MSAKSCQLCLTENGWKTEQLSVGITRMDGLDGLNKGIMDKGQRDKGKSVWCVVYTAKPAERQKKQIILGDGLGKQSEPQQCKFQLEPLLVPMSFNSPASGIVYSV